MQWETAVQKFHRLSAPYLDSSIRQKVADRIAHLEAIQVSDLMALLRISDPTA
jgi:hypothetical protein